VVLALPLFIAARVLQDPPDALRQAAPLLQDGSSRDDRFFVERMRSWLAANPDAGEPRRPAP
jgi:cytochrome c-type biogenesis protein CcmH/NrfG